MPAYNAGRALVLFAGDTYKLYDAESPANGTKSQQIALQPNIDLLGLDVYYATAPASCEYRVEVADEDVEARYREIATTVNVLGERIPIANVDFKFLRIHKVSQVAGGVVTVSISAKRKT